MISQDSTSPQDILSEYLSSQDMPSQHVTRQLPINILSQFRP